LEEEKEERTALNGQEKQGRENDSRQKASGEGAGWKGAHQRT
jgi:hypothetical protein